MRWPWRPVTGNRSRVTSPAPRVSWADPATPGQSIGSGSAVVRGAGGGAEGGEEAGAVCGGGPGVTAAVTVTRVRMRCSVTRGSAGRGSSSVTCPGYV